MIGISVVATLISVLLVTTDCTAQSNNTTTTSPPSSYEVLIDGIFINDVVTKTDDIAVIHTNKQFDIVAKLVWSSDYYDIKSNNEINWVMYVNNVEGGSGVLPLVEHYSLPATLAAGSAILTSSGKNNIKVVIKLDSITNEYTRDYQSFPAGHSLWPLVIIIIFAITTRVSHFFLFVCT